MLLFEGSNKVFQITPRFKKCPEIKKMGQKGSQLKIMMSPTTKWNFFQVSGDTTAEAPGQARRLVNMIRSLYQKNNEGDNN